MAKLTQKQLEDAKRRHLDGESIRSIARDFKVAESTLRERISAQTAQIKNVAKQLVETRENFERLPPSAQILASDLASRLRAITSNLAEAAHNGSITASNVSKLAKDESLRLIDKAKAAALINSSPIDADAMRMLQGIDAMNRVANGSASISLELLKINKEVTKNEADEAPPLPRTITVNVQDAS